MIEKKYKDYYIALYDQNDVIITTFESFEELSNFTQIPKNILVWKLKNNENIKFGKARLKIWLMHKFDIEENSKGKCR